MGVQVNGEVFNATGGIVNGQIVKYDDIVTDDVKPLDLTPPGPFDAFSETVRTSLEGADIRTVDDLKGKTEADLVALRGVGEATAKDLLKLAPAE